jgi:hypothetical protein
MNSSEVSKGLQEAGADALEKVQMGDIDLFSHDYEITANVEREFEWWCDDIGEDLSEIINFIPNINSQRIKEIEKNPQTITQGELFEWSKNYLLDIPSDSTFFFFIPIQSKDGEDGLALIMSYSEIPGGEYELYGVFKDRETADEDLKGMFWF